MCIAFDCTLAVFRFRGIGSGLPGHVLGVVVFVCRFRLQGFKIWAQTVADLEV